MNSTVIAFDLPFPSGKFSAAAQNLEDNKMLN
jgi:hypothetical protein